jgi:hypothetical protein
MLGEWTRWLVFGLLIVLSCAAAPLPSASLDIAGDPIQPADSPILLTLTVRNTGQVPISYWWTGPGDYPDAREFFALLNGDSTAGIPLAMELVNGQYRSGSGRRRNVLPGQSITFPVAMTPQPPGKYKIEIWGEPDGRRVNGALKVMLWPPTHSVKPIWVEVREGSVPEHQRDEEVLAGVRANDAFYQYVSATWPRVAVRKSLLTDLIGGNIVVADRAAEGLWAGNPAPPLDETILAQAIVAHLQRPADVTDDGLMGKLLNACRDARSAPVTNALVRLMKSRKNEHTYNDVLAVLAGRGSPPKKRYDIGVFHVGPENAPPDPAALEGYLALASSSDPHARTVAFEALGDYPDSAGARKALLAGQTDTDAVARAAAINSLTRIYTLPSHSPGDSPTSQP